MTSHNLVPLALALLAVSCTTQESAKPAPAAAHTPGCVIVAYSADSADTLRTPHDDSLTVLEWLRLACDSARLTLDVQSYAFGDLVIQIGDKKNGEGGYWLYKVNSQPVPEAASAHRVAPSDTLLFFYR